MSAAPRPAARAELRPFPVPVAGLRLAGWLAGADRLLAANVGQGIGGCCAALGCLLNHGLQALDLHIGIPVAIVDVLASGIDLAGRRAGVGHELRWHGRRPQLRSGGSFRGGFDLVAVQLVLPREPLAAAFGRVTPTRRFDLGDRPLSPGPARARVGQVAGNSGRGVGHPEPHPHIVVTVLGLFCAEPARTNPRPAGYRHRIRITANRGVGPSLSGWCETPRLLWGYLERVGKWK